jgi:hypothetical protein
MRSPSAACHHSRFSRDDAAMSELVDRHKTRRDISRADVFAKGDLYL